MKERTQYLIIVIGLTGILVAAILLEICKSFMQTLL